MTVYKKAVSLAMEIFEVTKAFPKEEKYSLTDQIRGSSRLLLSVLLRRIEKETTNLTSKGKHLMLAWRTVKPLYGWSLLSAVSPSRGILEERANEVRKLLKSYDEQQKAISLKTLCLLAICRLPFNLPAAVCHLPFLALLSALCVF